MAELINYRHMNTSALIATAAVEDELKIKNVC